MHPEDQCGLVDASNAGRGRSAYAQYVVPQLAIGLICIMYVGTLCKVSLVTITHIQARSMPFQAGASLDLST